ncbi:MAG: hypothetical protein P4L45_05060 [Ignavibacteriaceae bacterium]|nr:hypothetical protein [Ignavibacteriaceae bacterium]
MKLYSKFIMAALACCLMILIESCSTSILVDVWNDPSYNEPPLKKILIIAVSKDPVHRRIWEDAFVNGFSANGVKAIPSYSLYPDASPDTNQVFQAVQENGFDGILVTSHLLAGTKTRYVQGYVTSELRSRYNRFKNVYYNYYQDVDHPAYVDSLLVRRRAIDLWTTKNDEQMIWGATSNTPELNTVQDIQSDIVNLVIAELEGDAIIKHGK